MSSKWRKTTPKELKRVVAKPRGIFWVEQEGEAFYFYVLSPTGEPSRCRGRYTKAYRAEQAAESFGFVKGEKP